MAHFTNTPANQATVVNAVVTWFGRAQNITLNAHTSAWLQPTANNTIFYNCGGITGANGYGYGVDYVSNPLYVWLAANMAAQLPGYAIQPFPGYRGAGLVGLQGHRQFAQDYYNITRVAINNHPIPANTYANVPGGNYRIVLNFHLYVGAQYPNPHYQAPPPPPGPPPGGNPGVPPASLSVAANPDQWPVLSS